MIAIAIAIVIAVIVAAVAYAGPKLYWYHTQTTLIRESNAAEEVRFAALKESHDLVTGPPPAGANVTTKLNTGQYL